MQVELTEDIITGLKEIQKDESALIHYFRNVEDFIIDSDIKRDAEKTLSTIRLVRLIKTYIMPLMVQGDKQQNNDEK